MKRDEARAPRVGLVPPPVDGRVGGHWLSDGGTLVQNLSVSIAGSIMPLNVGTLISLMVPHVAIRISRVVVAHVGVRIPSMVCHIGSVVRMRVSSITRHIRSIIRTRVPSIVRHIGSIVRVRISSIIMRHIRVAVSSVKLSIPVCVAASVIAIATGE